MILKIGESVLVSPKFGLKISGGTVTKITPFDGEFLVSVKAEENGYTYVVWDKFLQQRT